MEKELAELRERLSKVEVWKERRREIEEELGRVWVDGDGEGQGGQEVDETELEAPGHEDVAEDE